MGIIFAAKMTHFCLLVEAISLLSKSEISVDDDLARAKLYLQRFCLGFAGLYGMETPALTINSVINIHRV